MAGLHPFFYRWCTPRSIGGSVLMVMNPSDPVANFKSVIQIAFINLSFHLCAIRELSFELIFTDWLPQFLSMELLNEFQYIELRVFINLISIWMNYVVSKCLPRAGDAM